jgi:hypothetical protein
MVFTGVPGRVTIKSLPTFCQIKLIFCPFLNNPENVSNKRPASLNHYLRPNGFPSGKPRDNFLWMRNDCLEVAFDLEVTHCGREQEVVTFFKREGLAVRNKVTFSV